MPDNDLFFSIDDLANLSSKNEVVEDKHIVIVKDGEQLKFKIGNGAEKFNDLKYVSSNNAEQLAKALANAKLHNGINNKCEQTSFAAGAFNNANAKFSAAFGFNSSSKPEDEYSFIWNGDGKRNLLDKYQSHGTGTFNLNPIDGVDGVYIGDKTLKEAIKESIEVSQTCKSKNSTQIAEVNGTPIFAPESNVKMPTLNVKVNGKQVKKIDFSKAKKPEIDIQVPVKMSDLENDISMQLADIDADSIKVNGISLHDYVQSIVIDIISKRFYELQQHYSKFIMESFAKFLIEENKYYTN